MAKHAVSNIPIDGIFAEGHAIAPCPELPLDLCNHLCGRLVIWLFSFGFIFSLATRVVARAWAWLCTALCFLLFCLPIWSWCDIFPTFLSGDGRILASIPPTTETAAGTVVIV